ncbi:MULTISPECIES: polysaccharide deacetylase family protein [Halococcus]|uniref:Polysaccharide deacetylase n=1 Tax=Halococcus salifodinae DSM 8989 TaxID=1227456 RepID=M0MYZ1_9EURY|nr:MULTISPECIES: polysaccharide deacetylase family protein [Halococcus]EMA50074.1 polysaccharide deacetylase [Halococcus salifodinae DSM 8989]
MDELRRRDALTVFGSLSASLAAMFGVTMADSAREDADEPSSSGESPTDSNSSSSQTNSSAEQLAYAHDVRARARAAGRPLSTVTDLGEWTATNGKITPTDWRDDGTETAVRLDSPASATRTGISTTFDREIDLTTAALSLGIELERAATETLRIRLFAPDERNQFTMQRYCKRRQGAIRLDVAPGETIGAPDPTAVRGLSVESYTGGGKSLGLTTGALRVRDSPQRRHGAVILTFDDGDRTQLEAAKPLMDEYGFAGTVGVIPWLVGEDNRIGRQELHEMAADGWEMASHPQREGSPLPSLSKSDQRALVERSKRWLLDEGFEQRGESLIWPFGAFDEQTLDLVGEYHRLAFAGGSSTAPWAITEPGWVPRVNGDDSNAVKRAIDMAEQFGSVATLMYHTIGETRLSIDGFREQLRYIDRADVDVIVPSALANAQPY